MDIFINEDNLILKASKIKNLPNFVVITGENGSGKTQLLNSIANSINMPIRYDHALNRDIFQTEVIDNFKLITKINYIPVNEYYIHLGDNINPTVLNNNWGKLPLKYFSFLNLKRTGAIITTESIFEQFKKDTGFNDSNYSRHHNLFTDSDINLFNKIYDNKINKLEPTTIQECIINVPIQSHNLFSANLSLLYLQHFCRIELGLKTHETPWDIFNEILKEAKFKYRLKDIDFIPNNYTINIQLIDITNNNVIDIHSLSSGERTIMSLILALYNSENMNFPELILFDEPDSSLHPSMSKQMLDVLQNVFVEKKKCKVIITTHSPTTVALSPDLSIYIMDRKSGCLIKEKKENAIKNLTKGLENISIYYENRKQIFVESLLDKTFFELTYNVFKRNNLLNESISLEFITTSNKTSKGDENGGCHFLRNLVNSLRTSGNNTVFGIIDYDNKNSSTDYLSILGGGRRYSIENYLLDPIFLILFILKNEDNEKNKIKIPVEEYIINFNKDIFQERIDNLIIAFNLFQNDKRVKYTTINGGKYEIPESWYKLQGHKLEKIILEKIPFLRKYNSRPLSFELLDIIKMFTEFLPAEIIETFQELEKK